MREVVIDPQIGTKTACEVLVHIRVAQGRLWHRWSPGHVSIIHRGAIGRGAEQTRARLAAVDATSGKYSDVFTDDYLADLREDWPE